ncbi:MAG: hypothetical protein K2H46_00045 [Muribaculaceae bacterium]|nr:hypothetical protein [Muribaculaceae bacterium]
MIKVGILGADSPDGGELLRILIHHPEVDLRSLYSPSLLGRKVSSFHHGFIGEQDLFFTDKIDPSSLDALFILDDSHLGKQIVERIDNWPELRIINLSKDRFENWTQYEFDYGLSEINRKTLVRGSKNAVIPSSPASVALIALYPLASHLLLTSDIQIDVDLPADSLDEVDKKLCTREIEERIQSVQRSFDQNVEVNISSWSANRAIRVRIGLKCPLGIDEISKVYQSVYDDHNFTFISNEGNNVAEVEGTQKCIISFSKPGAGLLEIEAVADGRLRGGAGDAVHVLNLFFALHEKIGLSLKPSAFGNKNDNSNSQNTSWFA